MIQLYDTTLRDGSQGEGVSFTVQDKLRVARRLDDFGMQDVEGGWPGSNPKDIAFFEAARDLKLRHARLCAFGSTRRRTMRAATDPLILQLADSGAPVVTIFGKSWMLHVTEVLGATAGENLEMIADTIGFLKSRGLEAIYDAEHFFDGYKDDPEYALATLRAAHGAGADILVLCDTNGGTMPWEIAQITRQVKEQIGARIGIHAHNDCELGVANTIAAVQAGAIDAAGVGGDGDPLDERVRDLLHQLAVLERPGVSDSSALQTRYLTMLPWGRKEILRPIWNPAPPRPRIPESMIWVRTSPGDMLSALRSIS